MSFFLTTFILTIIIIGISLLVRKKRPFMYLIPIVLMAISMILFLRRMGRSRNDCNKFLLVNFFSNCTNFNYPYKLFTY